MPDGAPADAAEEATTDAADEAMVARARERFGREHRRAQRGRLRPGRGALPNLVVIGGLKCGTTSLHHYVNLHPNVYMSRPKELNFFVEELNWPLGTRWYASQFPAEAIAVRGESSPHYTNLPRFQGVAERMRSVIPHAHLIYLVRDPIERLLSHYLHNVGGGYERRPLEEAVADEDGTYVARSRYATQLEPYLNAFWDGRIEIITAEELHDRRAATMRRLFAFLDISMFESEQFEREWETGTAKGSGRFRLMDRAVRLPGLRGLDRNFDRFPESLRWIVERVVHDPQAGAAPKPEVPRALRERLERIFRPEVERLEDLAGRPFGWLD